MVSFTVAGDNSTNVILSVKAYDLVQPTNRAAFASLPGMAQRAAAVTSQVGHWTIYVLREKHGESQAEVRDCFLSGTQLSGLNARLTIPATLTLTKDQRNYMEQEFKDFLKTIEVLETK